MSDKENFPFWSDDWMKSQQDYLDSWTEMSSKMTGAFQPKRPSNPWIEALGQWESMIPGNNEAKPHLLRMLDQGKAFFQVSEEISSFIRMLDDANKSTDEWQQAFRDQMEGIKATFDQGQGDLSAFWDQPLTAWKDLFGDQAIDPQDFFKDVDTSVNLDEFLNPVYDNMDKLLSTPGVGPDRESHEQQRRFSKLWMEYQRTLHEYNSSHHRVGRETIERLTEKAIELSERGETLDSMRDVYDLWVDCAEDAYADFAYSDEYQAIYGRLINSQMALKKEARNMVDNIASNSGLPSSRGFDTVLKRMQEMRREIRQMKRDTHSQQNGQSSPDELTAMREEIKTLRKEVNELKKRASGSPRSASKKKVARKKTATKKTT